MSYLDPRLQDGQVRSSPSFAKPKQPYYAQSPAADYSHNAGPVIYDQSPSSDQDTRDPAAQANFDQDDPKRPRACESCRGLKVRCDQDPANPEAPCRRCTKANRQCIYTQPSRRRQKKADTRVADLEKKLDALTAALQAQHYAQGPLVPQTSHSTPEQQPISRYPDVLDHPQQRMVSKPSPATASTSTWAQTPPNTSLDAPNKRRRTDDGPQSITEKPDNDGRVYGTSPIARWPLEKEAQGEVICGIVALSDQQTIVDRFINSYVPTLPAISLTPGTKARDLLENSPALLLGILATAGFGILPEDVTNRLLDVILEAIAEIALRRGHASFEIVQMMLIVVLWIKAPQKPDRSGFYMTVHLACTMAIDLGLGKRYNAARARKGFILPGSMPPAEAASLRFGPTAVDSESLEARRVWLACFYCAAAAAMALRRPNLLRWTTFMQECVDVLETSPEASPMDALFCQYVRLQKICDDISIAFKMDDPTATTISISDPKVSYQLDIYEQKIKDWQAQLRPEYKSNSKLMFFYDVTMLYLHEISLHVNHNVDDFQLPFTEEGLKANSQHSEILTQRQMASLEACLTAAHRVISTFVGFGPEGVAITPTLFYFVRCMYALIVLIKMHLAVTAPGSEVAKIISPSTVRVVENMEMIWTLFQEMERHPNVKPPPKAIRILSMLRNWLLLHKDGIGMTGNPIVPPASKTPPFGRNPHGDMSGSSKLQVLSEAATAGHDSNRSSGGLYSPASASQSESQNSAAAFRDDMRGTSSSNWTVDGPDAFRHHGRNALGRGQNGRPSNIGASMWMHPSVSMDLPQTPLMYSAPTTMRGRTDNADWMQGMDLDQLLSGAFEGFDASGDMGQFFFGDGVGAYQLPTEGTAPPSGMKDTGRW